MKASAFAAVLLLFAGCAKQAAPEVDNLSSNVINLTVSADRFAESVSEDGTRIVTGSDGKLEWEGTESIGIIFAKTGAEANYKYVQELKTLPGHPGVFSGSINFGEFSMSDIIGMVCPYSDQSWGRCHNSYRRIVMQVGAKDYVQEASGVMNWNDVPFFAELSSSDFEKTDGGYMVSGKEMKCGASLLEFTVYGTHPSGLKNELMYSIRLNATTTKCAAGTAEWGIKNDKYAFVGNTDKAYLKTYLATPYAIREEGKTTAKAYVMALPRGDVDNTKVKFTKVIITTRRAIYEKTISQEMLLGSGTVQPVKMDLATFTRTAVPFSETPYESLTLARGGTDSNQKKFVYNYYEPLKHLPIDVYYYIPTKGDITKMPILFAMHGNGRAASTLLKSWRPYAEDRGIIVIAPCFAEKTYSQVDYHLGGVSYSNKAYMERPYELRTYNIIEKLFDLVKDKTGNTNETYDISGHSAGSQFTHRFLLNTPEARVGRAVSSNAGYYTFPIPEGIQDAAGVTYSFPYSILGMDMPDEQLAKFFARDITIHLGTADTATTTEEDEDLPVSDGAEAQGKCRFERGHYFFDRCKAQAAKMGVPFNWKLVEVSGVGHSSSSMIKAKNVGAADLLYGN